MNFEKQAQTPQTNEARIAELEQKIEYWRSKAENMEAGANPNQAKEYQEARETLERLLAERDALENGA